MRVGVLASVSALLMSIGAPMTQTEKSDASPHKVTFVTVEPGVKLQVLDWGGTGRPLVFLAGLGGTAHGFDTFALNFTNRYHVFGITRRGYAPSDMPALVGDSYAADRLGDDLLAVLDQLKLQSLVLVGHSFTGEEMSSVGSRFPNRVAGLTYLDAAFRYALSPVDRGDFQIDTLELKRRLDAVTNAISSGETRAAIAEVLKVLPQYERTLRNKPRTWRTLLICPQQKSGTLNARRGESTLQPCTESVGIPRLSVSYSRFLHFPMTKVYPQGQSEMQPMQQR